MHYLFSSARSGETDTVGRCADAVVDVGRRSDGSCAREVAASESTPARIRLADVTAIAGADAFGVNFTCP